jgi:hypothetical protein
MAALRRIEWLGAPTFGEIGITRNQLAHIKRAGWVAGGMQWDGYRFELTDKGRQAITNGSDQAG